MFEIVKSDKPVKKPFQVKVNGVYLREDSVRVNKFNGRNWVNRIARFASESGARRFASVRTAQGVAA